MLARLLDWGAPSSYKITARLLSRRDRPLLPLAPWRVVVERASYLPDWARDNNTSLGTVYVAAAPGWFLSPTRPRAAGTRRKCRAFFQRLWPRPKHSYRLGSRFYQRRRTMDNDRPRPARQNTGRKMAANRSALEAGNLGSSPSALTNRRLARQQR